jgi:hypothetical protein
MSGGQISWPRLVAGWWLLVEDTPAAQCRMKDELPPEKTRLRERATNGNFFTRGIDTLDRVV